MRFALLSVAPSITMDMLTQLAAASTPVLAEVAASWSTPAPETRVVTEVRCLTNEDVPILFVPKLDIPTDLAYHSIAQATDGLLHPYALVLAAQAWDMVTQSAFHEMAEALVDPSCNLYVNGLAKEICDPVQNDGITRDGVLLSAWVTPAWFGIGSGPCAVSDEGFELAPGTIRPGGYCMHQDGTRDPAGYCPLFAKCHQASRMERRAIRLSIPYAIPAA